MQPKRAGCPGDSDAPMVARSKPGDEPPARGLGDLVSALFESWRRMLGLSARSVREQAGEAVRFAEDVVGEVSQTTPGLPANSARRASATLIAAGLLTLATGIVGTVLIGRGDLRNSVASAGLMALWCLARVALMSLAVDAKTPSERDAIVRAWAIGLLPYAIAFTPPLQGIAWTVSAALAFLTLRNRGLTRRAVTHALAWGYGSQVLALVAAWVVRNAFVAGAAISG